MACSTTPLAASTVATTRSIASRARSGLLTLTFNINQLPGPRNWAMAAGSSGCRAGLVMRQLTQGLISSSPGTAGLPPFISFSTSYPELDSAAPDSELLFDQITSLDLEADLVATRPTPARARARAHTFSPNFPYPPTP